MFRISISAIVVLLFASLPSVGLSDVYNGNGNLGFGGGLGNGTLEITDNGVDTITFCLDLASPLSASNDVIIYVDSKAGGYSDTGSFTDTGDAIRVGISNYDGNNPRTTIEFDSFLPDYAIGANDGFQDLWELQNNSSHLYLGGAGVDKTGSNYGAGDYKIALDMSLLGISPGDTINFAVTQTSNTGFLSDELIAGGSTGFSGGNPGFGANPNPIITGTSYTVGVPEPGTASLWVCVLLTAACWRRRK